MQDRYLFRGMSTQTDKFVIGTLSVNMEGEYFIDDQLIYQNTVGQCTGLKDKNGTLIFESDIVKGPRKTEFGEELHEVKWSKFRNHFLGDNPREIYEVAPCLFERMEVVGNIHVNPEILVN